MTLTKGIFELLAYACLGLCAWHAWGLGPLRRARMLELGMGVAYGVTLEVLTIAQFHAYRYGQFLVMVHGVPLCIGVDWGVILYTAMSFADGARLPRWAAPALAGLLGLTIDFSMDAVAIRQDMWHWNIIGLMDQWYGVPWANFYAWFIVLCSASALFWLARPLTMRPGWRGPLALVGAYVGSLMILAALDELVSRYDKSPGAIPLLPVALLVGLGLAVVVAGAVTSPPAPLAAWSGEDEDGDVDAGGAAGGARPGAGGRAALFPHPLHGCAGGIGYRRSDPRAAGRFAGDAGAQPGAPQLAGVAGVRGAARAPERLGARNLATSTIDNY